MSKECNIVVEWLHSLHLGEYAESFIDNGYDDLEICKQIREPDLDAIGVFKQSHRIRLLQSVKRLREEGAASVYFTLEESSACLYDKDSNNGKASSTSALFTSSENASDVSSESVRQSNKFLDEYEEGKAELVRIPKIQLQILLKEKLHVDGIRLACQPYTTPEGGRGYLEGLASRYADILRTHFGDVLEPLEELRRHEVNSASRRSRMKIPNSHSQTIYVPGKYSPSSCLTNKEEDEIYGFGYGAFGRQLLQQRQHKLNLAAQNYAATNHALKPHIPIYQSCLSPRSAYFYEFPPNEQGQNSSKKKMTFSRILKGLKTHRKEKQIQLHQSPWLNTSKLGAPQRIFRDIRRGLMQFSRDSQDPNGKDDIYMYDEEAKCSNFQTNMGDERGEIQHWYDEPPYESDPEDFLMDYTNEDMSRGLPGAKSDRGFNTLSDKLKKQEENIITLRSAGDISLPRDRERKIGSTLRGLIVPQGHNILPTIIPLKHSRTIGRDNRVCTNDIQSRSSEEEVNRASPRSQSTDYEDPELYHVQSKPWQTKRHFDHRTNSALMNYGPKTMQKCVNEYNSAAPVTSIAGRARTLRKDVQRKISRLKQQRGSINDSVFPCSASSVESLPSGSGSSSTQALVRAGSNHSSVSYEDREPNSPYQVEVQCMNPPISSSSGYKPPTILCRARAIVDCLPNPYDKDSLAFKKGDIIDVVQMSASGLWRGLSHNRFGHFKFINVEVLNERPTPPTRWRFKYRQKPGSVTELLQRMNLQDYISVFLLNGYEDLELFRELEPADLDFLRIQHPEHRAKILTAVQLLNDLQSGSEGDEICNSSPEVDEISGLDFGVSKLNINKQKFQQTENNLNIKSIDNQPNDFKINVPLTLAIPANTNSFTATLEQ